MKMYLSSCSDKPPVSLEGARALYKSLFRKLGDNQKNVVPQTVYLFPLKYLQLDPTMSLLKVCIFRFFKYEIKKNNFFKFFAQFDKFQLLKESNESTFDHPIA